MFTQVKGGWGVVQAINILVFVSSNLPMGFPVQPSGLASVGSYHPLNYIIAAHPQCKKL